MAVRFRTDFWTRYLMFLLIFLFLFYLIGLLRHVCRTSDRFLNTVSNALFFILVLVVPVICFLRHGCTNPGRFLNAESDVRFDIFLLFCLFTLLVSFILDLVVSVIALLRRGCTNSDRFLNAVSNVLFFILVLVIPVIWLYATVVRIRSDLWTRSLMYIRFDIFLLFCLFTLLFLLFLMWLFPLLLRRGCTRNKFCFFFALQLLFSSVDYVLFVSRVNRFLLSTIIFNALFLLHALFVK